MNLLVSFSNTILSDRGAAAKLFFAAISAIFVLFGQTLAQRFEVFEKPFVVCPTSLDRVASLKILASDNDKIYVSTPDALIAINARSLRTEWNTGFPSLANSAGIIRGTTMVFAIVNESGPVLLSVNTDTGLIKSSFGGIPFRKDSIIELRSLKSGEWFAFDSNGRVAMIDGDFRQVLWFRDFEAEISDAFETDNGVNLLFKSQRLVLDDRTGKTLHASKISDGTALLEQTNSSKLISGSVGGAVSYLDSKEDRKFWSIKTGGRITSLQAVGERILVTSNDNFAYFLTIDRGTLIWKKRLGARILFEPAIFERIAMISNSFEGTALIIDLADGRTINKIVAPNNVSFADKGRLVASRFFVPSNKGLLVFSSSGCE